MRTQAEQLQRPKQVAFLPLCNCFWGWKPHFCLAKQAQTHKTNWPISSEKGEITILEATSLKGSFKKKKKKSRSKLMLFEEAVMLYASETLSQEVTLVPSIRILWLLSQLPFLYVTCNIQIARRTRFTVHCIHCLTARREPATLPAVFLRGRESKRGREISFFLFFFLLFLAKQTHWTQALLGAAINPESDLWKHICFHVNQMLRRLWARRKRLPQIPRAQWRGGKRGEKRYKSQTNLIISDYSSCFPHTHRCTAATAEDPSFSKL